MRIKIGQRVKLKSYDRYIDWIKHKGETGTVISTDDTKGMFHIRIRWKDGAESTTTENNIISFIEQITIDEMEAKKC